MAAVPINLIMERGDTFTVSFNIKDTYGDYYNLFNHSVVAKMARNYSGTQTYDLNAQIVDIDTGLISLSIPASGGMLVTKTQDIPEGRYVYNVKVIDQNSKIETVIEGIVTVKGSVL